MNPNKIKTHLTIILIFCGGMQAIGQNNSLSKSDKGDNSYKKGYRFFRDGSLDSASFHFHKANNYYSISENWNSVIMTLRELARVEYAFGNLSKAINLLRDAKEIGYREDIYSEEHGLVYTFLGVIYKSKGQTNRAIIAHNKALEIIGKIKDTHSYAGADSYLGLGMAQLNMGNYRASLKMFKKAILNYRQLKNKKASIGLCYNMCGIAYDRLGSNHIALDFFKKAANTWRESKHKKNFASGLHNMAVTHFKLGNIELCKDYSLLADRQLSQLEGNKGNLSDYSLLRGAVFLSTNYLDSALYFFKKALKENIEYKREFTEQNSKIYEYLGNLYREQNNFKLSNKNYTMWLDLRKKLFGAKHKDVASAYNYLAKNAYLMGEYDSALVLFKLARWTNKVNVAKKNNSGSTTIKEEIHSHDVYINSALGIAQINELRTINYKKPEYIIKAHSIINSTEKSINLVLQEQRNHEDKIKLGRTISQIYEAAIRINLKLYDFTKEEKYKLQAFYFSEKSKAGVLTEALTNMSAKSFGILPDSVIALEKEIKIDQNYYRTKIQTEKVKLDGYDTLEVARWEDQLFTLNRQSDSLVLALEKNHPRYHELKYQSNILTVGETQQQMAYDEALIEYFVGEEQTYLFALTNNSYNIHTIENDSSRQDQIINFRKNLQESIIGGKDYMENYASQAHEIYNTLLAPALTDLDSGIQKLIIIPDADLGYIPFDILLTESMNGEKLSYQNLPYLLKKYQTTYGYSASLLFNDFERKQKKFDQQFLAFAPQYENLEIDSVRGLSLGKFRDQVTSLKYNTPEVNSINEYMDGLTFTGAEAREEAFKNYAGNSSILHLAMHAFVDDDNPMNSKLVFTQANDTIEDNFLHAYELYNMELPADMAVLSACETGFGKLEKGEGIMSLARAFSYAGCPSVVMSHWSVNDAATAKLMRYFYKYLSEGLEKDAALQQAKLEFLRTAGPVQANPFFWGSFVVMGNTDPIEMVKKRWEDWYYVVGLFLMLGMIVVGWKVWKGARVVSER